MKDKQTPDLFGTTPASTPPLSPEPTTSVKVGLPPEAAGCVHQGPEPEGKWGIRDDSFLGNSYHGDTPEEPPAAEKPNLGTIHHEWEEAAPEAHARHTDPVTSHEAARAVSARITGYQMQVLGYAATRVDFTDREMEESLGDSGSTYRTRRGELARGGCIENTGQTRVQRGRKHIVWAITEKGLARLRGQ